MRYAEFARRKGEKKSNLGRNAAIGAGVVGSAGAAGAAGLRYGRAELDPTYRQARAASAYRSNVFNPSPGRVTGQESAIRKTLSSGGARNTLRRDLGRVNDARKGLQSAVSGSRAGRAVSNLPERIASSRVGRAASGASNSIKSRAGAMAGSKAGRAILGTTTAGRIARGAGALGAGAAGTAAVMSYLRNRKKKNEPQGLVARGRRKISQLRGGN